MSVDIIKSFFLFYQALKDLDKYNVLDGVGKIAGVKRMSVAQQNNIPLGLNADSSEAKLVSFCALGFLSYFYLRL